MRHTVSIWGTLTARWRMVPDFVIVGAQRSGTTSLFRMLNEHPQVVRPTLDKGVAYFDLNYDRGFGWYRGHFPIRSIAALTRRNRKLHTFESSGYYLFHPLVAERIAADLPGTKIVVMLRNPVDRAHSAHKHELRRGFETEDFEKAIDLEAARTAGEADRVRHEPGYQSFELQHHAYLGRSRYVDQIARLFDAVGRDRVYIIDADRFFGRPIDEFRDLSAWLGLDDVPPADATAWNAAPRAPLSPELRDRLMGYFEGPDARLEDLTGQTPSWRSSQYPVEEHGDDPF